MFVRGIVDGAQRESMTQERILDYRGEALATVALASPITVTRAVEIAQTEGRKALQALTVAELLRIYDKASRLFVGDVDVAGSAQSLDDYARAVTRATGLPYRFALRAAHDLACALEGGAVERILRASSPDGSLEAYDTHVARRADTAFGWTPRGRTCAVVLPANHPGVSRRAVLLPAMKIPTILRASNREPFTPLRLTRVLLEAGLPPSALHLVATDRAAIAELLRVADLGLLYGSDEVVKPYEGVWRVKTLGPGRSKVIVTRAAERDLAVDLVHRSLTDDAGRGCINASGVLVEDGACDPSEAVAARLESMEPIDPLDPRAEIGALEPKTALKIAAAIASRMGGAPSVIKRWKRSVVEADGATFLVPHLFRVPASSPAFAEEYSGIVGTVATASRDGVRAAASRTLSVAMAGADEELARELLRDPTISKVYRGAPTNALDLAQPHQGFFTDFLFTAKAWS